MSHQTYSYRLDTGEVIHVPAVVSKVVYYSADMKKISKAEYENLTRTTDGGVEKP